MQDKEFIRLYLTLIPINAGRIGRSDYINAPSHLRFSDLKRNSDLSGISEGTALRFFWKSIDLLKSLMTFCERISDILPPAIELRVKFTLDSWFGPEYSVTDAKA